MTASKVKMDEVVLTDFETVTWTYVGYATKDELVHDTSVDVAQLEVRHTAAARAAVGGGHRAPGVPD